MAEKNLLEILKKYTPDTHTAAWLGRASGIKLRADKERRMLEIEAFFPEIVKKKYVYAAEEEIANMHWKGLKWDPVAERVVGNDAAQKLTVVPHHNGWTL